MSFDAVEVKRQSALKSYEILETHPEEAFDRVTRIAKQVVRVPTAFVSFVEADRQWFKSRIGIDLLETPRDISFCNYTIRSDDALVVPDATNDHRFSSNPLVTGEPHIRFYCGLPLVTPDGHRIGSICTVSPKPRNATPGQVACMRDLAKILMSELELRRVATIDSLTGLMTRRSFEPEARRSVARARRHGHGLVLVVIDVDHFKRVNDTYGHAAGDHVLKAVADLCKAECRATDFAGRLGGEEFAIGLIEATLPGALVFAERLRRSIESAEITYNGRRIPVTASFGVAAYQDGDDDFPATLARADEALYRAKGAGRNRVELWAGASERLTAAE